VNLNLDLDRLIESRDPKCLASAQDPADCPLQTIGSFEFELRYAPKLVRVSIQPGALFLRSGVSCWTNTNPTDGIVQFHCVTSGKPADAPGGPGTLAVLRVRPSADIYWLLVATQDNGDTSSLITQDCQLSDLQGNEIPTDLCDDAAVTVRYLEGDVHPDCVVNVYDQQQIAFRWGARLGQLLYSTRYDLEPSSPIVGDGDIDANDIQVVFGRHGSTCKAPHPPQPPRT
jgi:hypothetical protein